MPEICCSKTQSIYVQTNVCLCIKYFRLSYSKLFSFFMPVLCSLNTVLDKHALLSLRKVITHNSSPWSKSIKDEIFIAKRERRQAERKWRNTKLTIFKDLYKQARHKVSQLVHTDKCTSYTEKIAMTSSSKEQHQVVNTLKYTST